MPLIDARMHQSGEVERAVGFGDGVEEQPPENIVSPAQDIASLSARRLRHRVRGEILAVAEEAPALTFQRPVNAPDVQADTSHHARWIERLGTSADLENSMPDPPLGAAVAHQLGVPAAGHRATSFRPASLCLPRHNEELLHRFRLVRGGHHRHHSSGPDNRSNVRPCIIAATNFTLKSRRHER